MEITVVSLDAPWRKFMVTELSQPPYQVEPAEESNPPKDLNLPPTVNFLSGDGEISIANITDESRQGKKIALFTHFGAAPIADFLETKGVSVINGGKFADATISQPDFVVLEASKHRFFVAPADEEGERTTYVLTRTKRGIIPHWLELTEYTKLFSNGPDTSEGCKLCSASYRDEVLERKIEAMCRGWGYIGFIFISGVRAGSGEFMVEKLTAFGPECFYPAFFNGYQGNITKFFCKMENSRRLMQEMDFKETYTLKATLAPYPYNKAPWVEEPEEKKFVEHHLNAGARGFVLEDVSGCGIGWVEKEVNSSGFTTGAEVGFISHHNKEAIASIAQSIHPDLQVKEI